MHLAELRLRDFRNFSRLDVRFQPGFHLILGDNGQGKTNILEAIYLLASLRSFRGVGGAQMVHHGSSGYFIQGSIVGPGEQKVRMYWSPGERKLSLNGTPVRKIQDYLGVLRAVVFCSEDLLLIKGTGKLRRRFVDLLLTQTHALYLPLLQRYMRALRSRNLLLKQRPTNESAIEGFTRELVDAGEKLIELRAALLPKLSPLARLAYRRISSDAEELLIEYQPGVKKDFLVELANSRARERALRSTLVGPHRDDLRLMLNGKPAAQFASEGQKRSLAIALKLAQAEYLTGLQGTPPIMLIDDVIGELDAKRRSAFIPLLERAHSAQSQVFMTCTERSWPEELSTRSQVWHVEGGTLRASSSAEG